MSTVIVGDETSFGLLLAWHHHSAVRRRLKDEPAAQKPAAVKAYWDVNRKGLD